MAVALVMVLVTASAAIAEERKPATLVISPQNIQQGIANTHQSVSRISRGLAASQPPAKSVSTRRRVLWTVIGAAGGFFGGVVLGGAIDNAVRDCQCDDAGLKGAVIGGPIGAAAGGIAGFVLSK